MTALNDVACSEDMDWFACPADWTRRAVAEELVYNIATWWLDEHPAAWTDDDDRVHGWVTAYRDLFGRIRRGWVRLATPDDIEDYKDGHDWWLPADASHPDAQPAWVVQL